MPRGEHARGVKNQQRMGKVSGAENPNTNQQAAERNRKRLQTQQEGTLRPTCDGALADQQPKGSDGYEAGKKCPEKNFAVRVIGGLEKPERGDRAKDGAESVHKAFEAEGATVGAGRNVSGEQGFFCWRTHAAAEPGSGATE